MLYLIENLYDYFPYGKVLRQYQSGQQERYLTTQHERDSETGYDNGGARYYDSDVARFLSIDPLQVQFPQWSSYNYVLGNPVYFIDPSGRETEPTGKDGEKKEQKEEIKKEDWFKGGESTLIDQIFIDVKRDMDYSRYSILHPDWGEEADPLGAIGSILKQTTSNVLLASSGIGVGVIYLGNRLVNMDFGSGRSSNDIKNLSPFSLDNNSNSMLPILRPDINSEYLTIKQGEELVGGAITIVGSGINPINTVNPALNFMLNMSIKQSGGKIISFPIKYNDDIIEYSK